MTKKITIEIEVNDSQLNSEEWVSKRLFLENEIDDTIFVIRNDNRGNWKNKVGKTTTGSSYKITVNAKD